MCKCELWVCTKVVVRSWFCRENHQRGTGVLGERAQNGLQGAGKAWWKTGGHSHMTQTWKEDAGGSMCRTVESEELLQSAFMTQIKPDEANTWQARFKRFKSCRVGLALSAHLTLDLVSRHQLGRGPCKHASICIIYSFCLFKKWANIPQS